MRDNKACTHKKEEEFKQNRTLGCVEPETHHLFHDLVRVRRPREKEIPLLFSAIYIYTWVRVRVNGSFPGKPGQTEVQEFLASIRVN